MNWRNPAGVPVRQGKASAEQVCTVLGYIFFMHRALLGKHAVQMLAFERSFLAAFLFPP